LFTMACDCDHMELVGVIVFRRELELEWERGIN